MDFGEYLQKGIRILQFETSAIREVYRDEEALLPAITFFALGGALSGVGQLSFRGLLFGSIIMTAVSILFVGLLHAIARLAGGQVTFLELYRPLGLAASIHWVQAIPYIGPLLGFLALLYTLVVSVVVLETVGSLPRSMALVVTALVFGLCLFLVLVCLAVVGSLLLFRSVFL